MNRRRPYRLSRCAGLIDATQHQGPGTAIAAAVALGASLATAQCPISFNALADVPGLGDASLVALADFNCDGHTDLAVEYDSGNGPIIVILAGNNSGGYSQPHPFAIGSDYTLALAVGDFNADGRPDLALSIYRSFDGFAIETWLGNGDGTFQSAGSCHEGIPAPSIAVGDFDGDQRLDLAVTTDDGAIDIIRGNGNGTFQPATRIDVAPGRQLGAIAAGNFNGDRAFDLAFLSWANGYTDYAVSVLLGTQSGAFAPAGSISLTGSAESITVRDLNGDGWQDLALTENSFDELHGVVTVRPGNGNGSFRPPVTIPVNLFVRDFAASDFSEDRKPDLVVISGSQSPARRVTPLRNSGPCTALQTLRQCDSLPAEEVYAPDQYDTYLAKLRESFVRTHHRPPICPGDLPDEQLICRLDDARGYYRVTAKGCELTALAIALRHLGVDPTATPISVHDTLRALRNETRGITPIEELVRIDTLATCRVTGPIASFKGAGVNLPEFESRFSVQVSKVKHDDGRLHDKLGRAFALGLPVMLRLDGCHHWVVAIDQQLRGDTWWYNVIDPGSSNSDGWRAYALCDANQSAERIISRPGGRHFAGQVNSPVRTSITDPLGRHLVCDAQGFLSREIPSAELETLLPVGTPDVPLTPDEIEASLTNAAYFVTFDDVIEGRYEIELLGTGDGDYSITFAWFTDAGEPRTLDLAGSISTGEIIHRSVLVGSCICPADFNCDGFLDFFDAAAFIDAFEAGDPAADLNHDDFLDFFDADAFLAAFEAGC